MPETEVPFDKKFLRLIPEGIGLAGANFVETMRANLVNPNSDPMSWAIKEGQRQLSQPNINFMESHPLISNLLQNSGDFLDGYLLAFAAYNSLALVDAVQSRITKRSIPEKIKSSLSLLAACGAVTLVESGILSQFNGSSDLNDIPAGVTGALAYLLMHHLGTRIVNKIAHLSKDPV